MKTDLVEGLLALMDEADKAVFRSIADCLAGLGYKAHKDRAKGYILTFKNPGVNQTIAKIGIRNGKKAFYSIKFFACKNPPEKFTAAVKDAILSSNGRYECVDCGICKVPEGQRGYHSQYSGKPFIRCGAYVVEVPGLLPEDVASFNDLLEEQHRYFLSLVR